MPSKTNTSITEQKKITVRPYLPKDRNNIISLLNCPSIKAEIWEWQFDNRYFNSGSSPLVAVDKWNNIVGYNGMMPIKIHTQQFGSKDAAWSCDFFVSRDVRGQGVGKEIKQQLKRQSNLILALGTSVTAANVLSQSGWKCYNRVYSYISKGQINNNINLSTATKLTALPERKLINELWDNIKNEYSSAVERNYAYLHWRYVKFPIGKYQFLAHYSNNNLYSFCVYRIDQKKTTLVDYVGPKHSTEDKQLFIKTLFDINENLNCTTSCTTWENIFSRNKFKKSKNPTNCFIYSTDENISEILSNDFYVMPGDCDGDILSAAISNKRNEDTLSNLKFKTTIISIDNFNSLQPEWDKLVKSSDNDNLFLSWLWVHTWWNTFSGEHDFKPYILASWINNELVGIAPLYQRKYQLFGRTVTQLQIIGCSWTGPNTFRSEYLDLIIDRRFNRSARYNLLEYIYNELQWDELVLGDIQSNSLTSKLITEYYSTLGVYERTVHIDSSVQVPTNLPEQEYKRKLSANFRRSMYNKFKHLQIDEGVVYFHKTNADKNIIEQLNDLHKHRWHTPCFVGKTETLHENLIKKLGQQQLLFIATLETKDKVIALAYCIIYGDTIYNIQLGFDEQSYKKYSIGLIQLGQCILTASNMPNINSFDLLAGSGKKEFYKSRFGGKVIQIQTSQFLRSKFLKFIYRIYDKRKIFSK